MIVEKPVESLLGHNVPQSNERGRSIIFAKIALLKKGRNQQRWQRKQQNDAVSADFSWRNPGIFLCGFVTLREINLFSVDPKMPPMLTFFIYVVKEKNRTIGFVTMSHMLYVAHSGELWYIIVHCEGYPPDKSSYHILVYDID